MRAVLVERGAFLISASSHTEEAGGVETEAEEEVEEEEGGEEARDLPLA